MCIVHGKNKIIDTLSQAIATQHIGSDELEFPPDSCTSDVRSASGRLAPSGWCVNAIPRYANMKIGSQ